MIDNAASGSDHSLSASQNSFTSMTGLCTAMNLRSDDTLTALMTANSETQVPTATFTPSSYCLTESRSSRSGDSDISSSPSFSCSFCLSCSLISSLFFCFFCSSCSSYSLSFFSPFSPFCFPPHYHLQFPLLLLFLHHLQFLHSLLPHFLRFLPYLLCPLFNLHPHYHRCLYWCHPHH